MINLGIDFGSTYTMVSMLDKDIPTVVQSSNNSYHYPSIVCYSTEKNKYFFGNSARNKLDQPEIIPFRGFKMLLAHDSDDSALIERGYTGVNTPQFITELFLGFVIKETLKKLNEDKVDVLVVGAPECWFQSAHTVDARETLRNICLSFCDKGMVNRFELRSEPTDAAAFCVWDFERRKNQKFNGKIMVIDYGGGTLDTALVKVTHFDDKIQIKPEILSGIGENHDNELGKAGIAYQEAVVRRAISDALDIPMNQVAMDKSFVNAVKQFEDALLADSSEIDEVFEDYEMNPEGLADENFMKIRYKDREISIDFAQMKASYDATIYESLNKVLEESSAELSENEQPYLSLVGGFCNFYLVRAQIRNFFRLGSINQRAKTLAFKEEDREKAIAYGACLLANNVLEVCHVAGFGIGMCVCFGGVEGKYFKRYAISYGQEYQPNQVYFAMDVNGNIAAMTLTQADKFLLNFYKKDEYGVPASPKEEIAKKLRKATQSQRPVVVGFSIDEAERIKVHIFDYHPGAGNDAYGTTIQSNKVIELSTFKNSFNNILYTPGSDTV